MKIKVSMFLFLAAVLFVACSKEEDDNTPTTPKTDPNCFVVTDYTDQLPNMDFETWGYPDSSDNLYKEPCGGVWASSNAVSGQFEILTNDQSTDAQNGTYSAKISTESALSGIIVAPGILFSGRFKSYQLDFTKLLSNAVFGVPFKERPSSLSGFHKYKSVKGDSAFVAVMLSRYNFTTMQKDTIGYGEMTIRNSVTSYAPFDVSIDYSRFAAGTETPDSVAIVFISSKEIEALEGQVGSTLWIDNCSFIY